MPKLPDVEDGFWKSVYEKSILENISAPRLQQSGNGGEGYNLDLATPAIYIHGSSLTTKDRVIWAVATRLLMSWQFIDYRAMRTRDGSMIMALCGFETFSQQISQILLSGRLDATPVLHLVNLGLRGRIRYSNFSIIPVPTGLLPRPVINRSGSSLHNS